MKATEDLFQLIKSLTMHEKMYFKRYASFHVLGEQNNYLALFDAINRQKHYDEKKLINHFVNHAFVRQFSVAKNRLYCQILNSLRDYHHSVHSEVRAMLHNAEILYEKELFGQSHKVIVKAKQIAREHEMHYALMELFRHSEMNLAIKNSDISWIQKILREEADELSLLQNTIVYRNNYFQIGAHHYLHGTTRNIKHLRKSDSYRIKKIMRSPFLLNENKAKTFEAKLRFHATHGFYCRIINDKRGLYLSTKNIIAHFKKHPQKIRQAVSSFIGHLNNMLDTCTLNKKYNEIPFYLKEFESLTSLVKSSDEKTRLFFFTAINRLNYYNVTGQFPIAVSSVVEINKQLGAHEHSINDFEKAMLFQTIALSYFGDGQYKNCIHWLNRIRNEFSLSVRPDFESFLRLFYIIVHYEAGNMDLVIPLIQSFYHYLKKKEQLHKFETVIIDFLRNELPKTNPETSSGQKELIQAFQKLKKEIAPLAKDMYEKNVFDFFDYVSWLDSKIENRSFAEVVRQKAESLPPDFI
ncbi:MAG: hypothetical protein EPN85_08150 [Bacteroidetes bacterium]|nr:MAG: hypothetical protein EPN85_08150 [Bacteroidota bacterium]